MKKNIELEKILENDDYFNDEESKWKNIIETLWKNKPQSKKLEEEKKSLLKKKLLSDYDILYQKSFWSGKIFNFYIPLTLTFMLFIFMGTNSVPQNDPNDYFWIKNGTKNSIIQSSQKSYFEMERKHFFYLFLLLSLILWWWIKIYQKRK